MRYISSLVFVHGLTGNRRTTWTKNNVLWPAKLLPKIFQERGTEAQIYTFGYDADITSALGEASQSRLREHGQALAHDVAMERRITGAVRARKCHVFPCG